MVPRKLNDVTLANRDNKQIGAHRAVLVKAKATLEVVWTFGGGLGVK